MVGNGIADGKTAHLDGIKPGEFVFRADRELHDRRDGVQALADRLDEGPRAHVEGRPLVRRDRLDPEDPQPPPVHDDRALHDGRDEVPGAAQIAFSIGGAYLLLTLSILIALWVAGMPLFDAVNHAMTTVSTGGFSTRPVTSVSVSETSSPGAITP